jgi:1-acyl-sn-glycerol-3-phosphate acyltransferase
MDRHLMVFIRSLLFVLLFYPGSVLCVLAAFPASLFGSGPLRTVTHIWVGFHHWCARLTVGVRSRVEGEMPSGAVLVAGKHQSMYETMEVVRLLHEPAVIMKRELSDIPLWGWVARSYGIIPVDREGGATALRRMVRAAGAAIAEDRPLIIFPEGTRVPVGAQPPLQPGFAGLYRALKLPVVPLAIDSGRIWPRGRFLIRPGVITFRFGARIPPGLPRAEIEAQVHREINILDTADAA